MNFEFCNAAASNSQGSTPGRTDRDSVPTVPGFDNVVEPTQFQDVNFGEGNPFPEVPGFEYNVQPSQFHDATSLEENTAAGSELSAIPRFNASDLPTVKGFRARWRARSQARCDEVSNIEGDESEPGSQSDLLETSAVPKTPMMRNRTFSQHSCRTLQG